MVAPPQFLRCQFITRYARSVSSTVYGFGLLQAHGSSFDEHCFCVFWFTTYEFMAPIVRIEPNGSQDLLSHDDAVDSLVQFGWVKFIQSFNGFNLEVARTFSKMFDGTRAKIEIFSYRLPKNS
jgi:hypothetical protein